MRYPVLVVLSAIVSLFVGCANAPESSAENRKSLEYALDAKFAEIRLLADQRRFAEAVEVCDQLVKRDPNNGNLVAKLATLLSRQADAEADDPTCRLIRKRARVLGYVFKLAQGLASLKTYPSAGEGEVAGPASRSGAIAGAGIA